MSSADLAYHYKSMLQPVMIMNTQALYVSRAYGDGSTCTATEGSRDNIRVNPRTANCYVDYILLNAFYVPGTVCLDRLHLNLFIKPKMPTYRLLRVLQLESETKKYNNKEDP